MSFTLTMPKLSPTMTEGTVAKWHKNVGDFVEAGELLLEVATDKAVVEYSAIDPGWLRKVIKGAGQKAAVNEPLALFTEQEKDELPQELPQARPQEAVLEAVLEVAHKTAPQPLPSSPQKPKKVAPQPMVMPPQKQERIMASPLAKAMARDQGIDLQHISGSGPRGRIVSRDLAHAPTMPAPRAETHVALLPPSQLPEAQEEIELTLLRQVIAERLQYSKSHIPHFYIRQEIEVSALCALREETKKAGVNLTVNDFLVKACVVALKKHPEVNSTFDPEKKVLSRYPSVDICVAVTIAGGLITPILFGAETKTLTALSKEVKELAAKAKAGKLAPHEFQGGTFTLTNLGMFGVTDFQAIINPPQTAILAIGTIQDTPVVKNGTIAAGKVMSLTLSCDHRAIDGAEAAKFMQTLKILIENPTLFLVE